VAVEEAATLGLYAVRRVKAEEWQRLKELSWRRCALRSPTWLSSIASRTPANGQSFWPERAETAAGGATVAQFVAVAEPDDVAGTVTALVTAPGGPDHIRATSPNVRAAIVGVYVRPRHRGNGVVQDLLAATEAWLRGVGVRQVRLHVNEGNTRPIGGYRKCGYMDSGKRVEMSGGLSHEMVHDLHS